MYLIYRDCYILAYMLVVTFFIFFLFKLICLLSSTTIYSSEKLSTYECGFIPFSDIANTFEISFCIIAIIFLLFDVEVLFLLPWVGSFSMSTKGGFLTMYLFFILVSLGLYVEWYKGILKSVGVFTK